MERLIDNSLASRLSDFIDESRRIVLTCHVRPDGDAIGSTLGLWHLLRSLGKEAAVVVPDQPPRSLAFLPGFEQIAVFTRHDPYCKSLVDEADLIIMCDFNTASRQDQLAPLIQNAHCRKALIDHHREPDRIADLMISYPDMSSTCELVFRLIAEMGLAGEVNLDCATCLLTGIITDSRNFTVNCKHPDIYEIQMRLLGMGVDKDRIVREALTSKSLDALRLEAYAILKKMEVFQEHKAALITLSRDELTRFSYVRGDTEGLVNRPLEVKSIRYSVFMREDDDCVKVSARSVNNFPVSEICKELYGGGGHIQAAGGEFFGSIDDCRRILLDNMHKFDKYLKEKYIPE